MGLYGVFSVRSKATMSHSSSSRLHRLRRKSSSLRTNPRAAVWVGVCLASFLLGLPSPGLAADKAPGWMHEAARQTLPAYPPETVAVVLLGERKTPGKDER